MKHLGFISNQLIWANCDRSWESVSVAVESLFIGSESSQRMQGDRPQQERGDINDDFGYAGNGLDSAAPKLKPRSGRYRYNAVPIYD